LLARGITSNTVKVAGKKVAGKKVAGNL